MKKFTRRTKKYKKNFTIKRGGATNQLQSSDQLQIKESTDNNDSVVNMLTDAAKDAISSTTKQVGDILLHSAGLERINDTDNSQKVNENIENISNKASDVVSNIGTSAINNVNEVLGSDATKESIQQAAQNTKQIINNLTGTFNDVLNNPETKAELKEAIKNAGEMGTVIAEAAQEPLTKFAEAGTKALTVALGEAGSGGIKIGSDLIGAIPGVGAVVDGLKALNDGSKALSATVKAGSEAIEVASDAFIETKENVQEKLKQLEEQKNLVKQISNRTTNSINQFENPLKYNQQNQSGGSRHKTKKRLTKYKGKSKRVRFAI